MQLYFGRSQGAWLISTQQQDADRWALREEGYEREDESQAQQMQTGTDKTPPAHVLALAERLLHFGGRAACIPFYAGPSCKLLTERGALFFTYGKVRMKRGAPSSCHENALLPCLRKKNQETHDFCTGYALVSEGDIWRRHSWAIAGGDLIETTCKNIRYWGLRMPLSLQGLTAEQIAAHDTGICG